MGDQFDRFTPPAKQVLALAQEEAQRLGHPYIGTQHVLLGLLREGDGVAARVLQTLGVEVERVRHAVDLVLHGEEGWEPNGRALTPKAERLLSLALEAAERQGPAMVGTEHLLLGLAREGEGVAVGLLESLGVRLETVRDRVRLATSGGA